MTHNVKLTITMLLSCTVLFTLCVIQAQPKATTNIDWLDVSAESALLILGLCWLALVLSARPGGRVTQLLIVGLLGYCLGCYMDLLDEFFINDSLPGWFSLIEKLPTPIGLLTLTVGLWMWREEQTTINEQLRTREQFYRQHQLVDHLTQLCDARAMRHQLNQHLSRPHAIALIMIDLDNFNQINRQQGFTQGDQLLTNVAQLLASQLRSQDLVCRYAGDRFIIMLTQCSEHFANAMAKELVAAISPLGCHASHAMSYTSIPSNQASQTAQQLIDQVNQKLEQVKCHQTWPKAG
ncbi:GGDEF domain-containing protein [Shewanella waksmanii]|uniref:GGDEF domain-containing protein n=1 Tax=Shewanella waksmanii TaxID=213783 RepID=UPI003734F09C